MLKTTNAQGDSCYLSQPFSTSTTATFPAGVNTPDGEDGPNYDCLGWVRNPAWYYMRISVAGDIIIQMTNDGTNSNEGNDIDFNLWGPFNDPHTPCTAELTSDKFVDCSFSPGPIETCVIPNGIVGEYYILVITNYSNDPCNISFEKIGGEGETDETIINTQAENNGPLCTGETLELTAETVEGASYHWTGPNGYSSNEQNPTIPNMLANMGGLYFLEVTLDDVTATYNTNVIFIEGTDFDITDLDGNQQSTYEICYGESIQFKAQGIPAFWTTDWNDGSTTTTSGEYSASGEISVTVENFFECPTTRTATLIVKDETSISLDIDNFCEVETGLISLNDKASPAGGVFTGLGVSEIGGNYTLDPSLIPAGGITNIHYEIIDASDCAADKTITVNRYATPVVTYSPGIPALCVDASTINLSGGAPPNGIYSYNGNPETTFNPATYGVGSHTIDYFYEDPQGCSNSASSSITINDLPNVVFDAVPPVCQNTGIAYIDQGSPSGGTYAGTNINGLGWFNSSIALGVYNVNYTYTDANGCDNIDYQTIEIISGPQDPISISASQITYCSAEAPTDLTLECTGPDDTYFWYANDYTGTSIGNSKILTIPAPTETTTYLVRSETSCGNSNEKSITVHVDPSPESYFETLDVCDGVNISFTDESNNNGVPITSWNWNFGNGNSSTLQNPSYTYTQSGTYTISLQVSNGTCSTTHQQDINIGASPKPPLSITPSMEFCSAETPSQISLSCTGLDDADHYFWYANNTSGSPIGNNKTISINPPNATTKYYVRSESGTDCGNSATLMTTVTINPSPVAQFSAANTCQGVSQTFTNSSSSVAKTWDWNFGDGGTSFVKNPSHIYTQTGTFTVSLTASTNASCEDTHTETIEVFPAANPPTDISADQTEYCSNEIPDEITLTVEGIDDQYIWYKGDLNGTAIGNSKTLTITAPTETSEYFARSESINCGNSPAQSIVITVHTSPIADFTVSNVCQEEAISIINNSSSLVDAIDEWSWDFGDGTSSTEESPSPSYSNYGNYDISLTTTTTNGCSDNIIQAIEVFDNPTANFTMDENCFGVETKLTSTSTSPISSIDSYSWQFDSQSFNTNEVLYNFPSEGTFNVILEVETNNGCSNIINTDIEVWPRPESAFEYLNPCQSNVVELTNNSLPSTGSTIDSYLWDFNNGDFSTDEDLTYIYPVAGIYEITLTVTDINGCSHELNQDNIIVSPTFEVGITTSPLCAGEMASFEGDPIPDFLPIDDYKWVFPDGSETHGKITNYNFSNSGTFTVDLIGTFGTCEAGKTVEVEVYELPTSSFLSEGLCLNSPINLSDQSTGDGVAITSWSWDFGDGNTSTETNPSITYSSIGNYSINLSVTDENNCVNSSTQNININPLPIASFSPQAPYCEGVDISFNNTSTSIGNFSGYSWDMGDGGVYTTESANHIFTNSGDQNIELTVIDEWLCSTSITNTISITPDFSLDITDLGLCDNIASTLNGEVIGSVVTPNDWSWSFDNGQTATGQSTSYLFNGAGSHDVILNASKNGCEETITKSFNVNPAPTAEFSNSEVAQNDPVDFSDLSYTNGGGSLSTWTWDFNDPTSGPDNTSNLQNPSHNFYQLGSYTVNLSLEDANGCLSNFNQTLDVYAPPVVDYSWGASCDGDLVQFTDESSTLNGSITNWWWDFGDPASGVNNASTTKNPSHTFSGPGIYEVQLVAKAYGDDTIVKEVTVYNNPIASYNFTTPCEGDNVLFTSTETLGDAPIAAWSWDFGDGNVAVSASPQHLYSNGGQFTVEYTIVDNYGCSNTISQDVDVWENPIANFNNNSACIENLTEFFDISTNGDATIHQWNWNFGEASSGVENTSTLQNPKHEYGSSGDFTITLEVEDLKGCKNILTETVNIAQSPVADFNVNSLCFGETTQFLDLSTGVDQPLTNWSWNFGDGHVSTSQNPSNDYTTDGDKTIQLIITDSRNCQDTSEQTYYITPDFQLDFISNNLCDNSEALLSANVINPILNPDSWSWSFEDGQTGVGQVVSHSFTSSGNQLIELSAIKNGCEETFSKTIFINPHPISNFSNTEVALGTPVDFTDLSTLNG
ncbi:PKD domain-containing protein, partial [Lentimicrobium sp. L6]